MDGVQDEEIQGSRGTRVVGVCYLQGWGGRLRMYQTFRIGIFVPHISNMQFREGLCPDPQKSYITPIRSNLEVIFASLVSWRRAVGAANAGRRLSQRDRRGEKSWGFGFEVYA